METGTWRKGKGIRVSIAALFIGAIFCADCAAAGNAVNLKVQHFSTGDQYERTMSALCYMVEKMTNGSVKMTKYPGGGIVPVKDMVNATRSGMIDASLFVGGYCSGLVPVTEILGGLPYVFDGVHESHLFMWHRGFVDLLRKEFAKHNLYFIPHETHGIGLMTNKAVNRLDDLKGMKLRSHSTLATWLTEAGASVVFVPATEVYTSLATKVVDGASWGDAGPMYEMKFPEVLKNYMWPDPLQGAWNVLLINMNVWNKLTPEQKIGVETASVLSGKITQEQTRVFCRRALDNMVKNHGVMVNKLSNDEQAKAKLMAEKVLAQLRKKDPLNEKVLDMLKTYSQENDVCPKVTPLPW